MHKPVTSQHTVVHIIAVVLMAFGVFGLELSAYADVFPADVKLQSSYPADGYICPMQDQDDNGNLIGLSEFSLQFSGSVQLDPTMISVVVSGGEAPAIAWVQPLGTDSREWEVVLDRPIPSGEWTEFILPDDRVITYGALPGDVNQDGARTEEDDADFQIAFQTLTTDVLRHDIDGDGKVDTVDEHALMQVFGDPVLASELTDPPEPAPGVVCCVDLGACSMYLGTECPDGITEVTCPCSEQNY